MRLPYVADPPEGNLSPEDAAIYERVRQRRIGGGHPGLLALDRALLHAPPVADGWNSFLGAIRTRTQLPDVEREVIICRVAALNAAAVEWDEHIRLLKSALSKLDPATWMYLEHREFSSDEEKQKLIRTTISKFAELIKGEEEETLEYLWTGQLGSFTTDWQKKMGALIAYVDAMTQDVNVPEKVFNEMKSFFPTEREVVEITTICAAYNCVARFLVSLEVGERQWRDVLRTQS